ncbi:MAG: thiol:disulfide interchange protein DsbA/DsbL [Campylobacteraceae bacterium]|jgi:thiol:disulfide interchange protein DsbA|nr:thiol:disulfide interchange protein DsbA/DsbL [Campylobacteraceae bacterium]
MKKFICRIVAAFLLFAVNAFGFTEGVDYVKLEKPIPNADKTLIKVFSYDCPFCYKYDKSVTPVVVNKLNGIVSFKPFHLKTKGKYGKEASELFAVLLVKDMDNGITNPFDDKSLFKKAKMAYYTAYHDKKERWDSGEASFFETGLKAAGISRADFDTTKNDQRVKDIVNTWEASYEVAKIQGVPAFVVNGKYLIYTKSIRSVDGMVNLVKELADK